MENLSLDISITAETEVFEANVVHNLGEMAEEAGLYKILWRPEEIDILLAKDAVPILERGLKALKENPEDFYPFAPEDKEGTYESLVKLVEDYLIACLRFPEGRISVSQE